MKKVMKLIAIIAVIAMATAMVATIPATAEDEVPRRADVGPFFFAFDDEDDSKLIFGTNRAFKTEGAITFNGPAEGSDTEGAFDVVLAADEGTMLMFGPVFNAFLPGWLGTGLWTPADGTLILAGAFSQSGTVDGEIATFTIVEAPGGEAAIGTVNFKGEIVGAEDGVGDFDPIPVDITISNRSESTPTPTPPTPTEEEETPTEDPTTDEPSGPPNSGVVLAIIPTLIAAGAAIVVSKKRK